MFTIYPECHKKLMFFLLFYFNFIIVEVWNIRRMGSQSRHCMIGMKKVCFYVRLKILCDRMSLLYGPLMGYLENFWGKIFWKKKDCVGFSMKIVDLWITTSHNSCGWMKICFEFVCITKGGVFWILVMNLAGFIVKLITK